jgi:hypothetical protein
VQEEAAGSDDWNTRGLGLSGGKSQGGCHNRSTASHNTVLEGIKERENTPRV